MDLSLQDSGPFFSCEGGSFEPTEPPGYGPGSAPGEWSLEWREYT